MGQWTLAHRIRWFVRHVRKGGLPELRRRVERYISPKARAARRRHLADAADFDAAHGYQTRGAMAIDDLTLAGAKVASNHYEGAATYDIVEAIALMDLPIAETTFIDIGCGMGRPLLIAADSPFKRIVGVEFARELLDIAERNFARRAEKHGPDPRIELRCEDATRLAIPAGPVAFFFFNSFGPPALNALLDNIHASWRADPRPIRFIYANVQFRDVIEGGPWRSVAVASSYHFTIYEPV